MYSKNNNSLKKQFLVLLCTLPLFTITACIDNDGEKDLNPVIPSNKAIVEDDDDNDEPDVSSSFPVFTGGGSLAFPDAEGYGRFATGGRDGEVYHVTNLNDSGEGSFRDAISKPNRIIVFDVSGVIECSSSVLALQKNQTILAHTAPGDGIVLYGGRISASGASNLIVRYLRMRMGASYPSQADACGIANGENMIFDHCSVTWGRDENFSINSDGKGIAPRDITIQNSIIGQGLHNHSCGGLIQTGVDEGVTLYRNLYIDNKTRNPKVKGLNQFVNNVVYNWGQGSAYNMGGDSAGESETAIENNYFIVGPGFDYYNNEFSIINPTKPFIEGNEGFRTYWKGNYYDYDKDGTLNGREMDWDTDCSGSPTFLETRSALHPDILGQTTAIKAYEWIVNYVGASLPARDQVDAYLIEELTSLGTKGTIIRNEANSIQFPIGGSGEINKDIKLTDTDGDGMPDEFEDKWGLDKNDPSDAMKKAKNGYTNLENYVFSLEFPEEYK